MYQSVPAYYSSLYIYIMNFETSKIRLLLWGFGVLGFWGFGRRTYW